MAVTKVALVVALLVAAANALDVRLFAPVRAPGPSAPEKLLVCVAGALVPGEEYIPLCQRVQAEARGALWAAVIVGFAGDYPNPTEVARGVAQAMDLARAAGFDDLADDDVWLLCHSLGGSVSVDLVRSTHAGMVLMGSYLGQPTVDLRVFPKPVLHLGGELDGLAQSSRIAEEYRVPRELLRAGDERTAVRDKPVVIFRGLNHAQMGGGFVTPALRISDFKAEISLDEATALLGSRTAAFIDLHTLPNGTDDAYALLRADVLAAEPFAGFFLDAQDGDAAGAYCVDGQRIVASLQAGAAARMAVDVVAYSDEDAFVESKPALVPGNAPNTINVTTTAYLESSLVRPDSEGKIAYELDCKLKSQEAVINALDLAAGEYGARGTCASINAYVYALALAALAPSQAQRHTATGKPLTFAPDLVFDQGNLWVPSHVNYTETPAALVVESTSLLSRDGVPVFGGMQYCKGLPAARAAVWVMHDSLPRGL